MLNLFKKTRNLENRVQELEVKSITTALKLKAIQDVLYRYYNIKEGVKPNGTNKNRKIKAKKPSC